MCYRARKIREPNEHRPNGFFKAARQSYLSQSLDSLNGAVLAKEGIRCAAGVRRRNVRSLLWACSHSISATGKYGDACPPFPIFSGFPSPVFNVANPVSLVSRRATYQSLKIQLRVSRTGPQKNATTAYSTAQ
jgi:hypothetical protein